MWLIGTTYGTYDLTNKEIREYESNVIKYVMTDISSQIGVSTHSSKTNNEMWESRENYTIHFCKTNNKGIGIGGDKVFWHDSKREKMQFKVSDLFIFAIRIYSHVNGFTDEFKVTGYTTVKSMIMHLTIQ